VSTIKSSAENLTLNADGSNNDIKFQSNGVEKASIDQDGVITISGITVGSVGSVGSSGVDLKISGTDDIFFNVSSASNNILQLYGGSGANDVAKFDASVHPLTDNSKDLGNASERWKDLYLSGGLRVGGTGAANTLDDYEEGTWTPTLTFSTAGDLNVVYSQRAAKYTKVGNLVTVTFTIRTSTFTHSSASSSMLVTGLPFTAASLTNSAYYGAGGWRGITKSNFTDISSEIDTGSSQIQFSASGSGQVWTTVDAGDTPSSGTVILRFTTSYLT